MERHATKLTSDQNHRDSQSCAETSDVSKILTVLTNSKRFNKFCHYFLTSGGENATPVK
jgi:hypothetical protein